MIHHVWIEGNEKQAETIRLWCLGWFRDNRIVGEVSRIVKLAPAKVPGQPLVRAGQCRVIIQSTQPIPAMMIKLAAHIPD